MKTGFAGLQIEPTPLPAFPPGPYGSRLMESTDDEIVAAMRLVWPGGRNSQRRRARGARLRPRPQATRGVVSPMAEAVALARLRGLAAVDRALGTVAMAGRFNECDLRSILDHQLFHEDPATASRAGEGHSLQPGTGFGQRSPL